MCIQQIVQTDSLHFVLCFFIPLKLLCTVIHDYMTLVIIFVGLLFRITAS